MIIDPLTDRPITCNHECNDITLACGEGIISEATFEPTYNALACEWVHFECPHRGRRLAVDVQHDVVENGGVVGWGAMPSQFPDHFVHLIGIDGGVIPAHAVASLDEVASDLPVSHAPHELLPGGLKTLPVGHTCLCRVVQKLIVLNPEGSVPGLVICPTVHGLVCVDVDSLQGQGRTACSMVDSASAVTLRAGVLVQKRAATAARMISRNIGSVPVTLAAHLGFVAATIIVLSGEIVVEVAAFHVVGIVGGLLTCSASEGSEGEAVEVGLFVHALSMAGLGVLWGKWWTVPQSNNREAIASTCSFSAVTVTHAIALPLAGTFQITMSS